MENEQLNNCSRNNYSFTSLSQSFLFTKIKYKKNEAYGEGYNIVEVKDSKEATEEEEETMEEADNDD